MSSRAKRNASRVFSHNTTRLPTDQRLAHAVTLESLEHRQLMATISVADFGAVANDGRSDTAAIQAAINASAQGDTIHFPAGTFAAPSRVLLRGDRTYSGSGTLRGGADDFIFSVAGNSSNVTIDGLKFINGRTGIVTGSGGTYRNIRITNNTFENFSGNGIQLFSNHDQITIERNTFTNMRGYGGALKAYNVNRLSYQFNRIIDSVHAGHILAPKDDVKVNYNWITGISVIGLEIQDLPGSVTRNLEVVGNVLYDFKTPMSGNIPLSIPVQQGTNTRIADNYIKTTVQNNQWGTLNWMGQIFGIAVEAGGNGTVVANNTIGGPWAMTNWITYANGTNGTARDNKFYGQPVWSPPVAPNMQQQNNQTMSANAIPGPEAWLAKREQMMGGQPQPNTAPGLSSGELLFQTAPHELRMVFDQSVGTSFTNSDLVVRNESSNQTIAAQIVANDAGRIFTIRFPGNNVLPDGDYTATIAAGSVTSLGGLSNPSPMNVSFFFLGGDANRDRVVNDDDMMIVRANFGRAGTFGQGDLNYDGRVNLSDFNVIAARSGRTMLRGVSSGTGGTRLLSELDSDTNKDDSALPLAA